LGSDGDDSNDAVELEVWLICYYYWLPI